MNLNVSKSSHLLVSTCIFLKNPQTNQAILKKAKFYANKNTWFHRNKFMHNMCKYNLSIWIQWHEHLERKPDNLAN